MRGRQELGVTISMQEMPGPWGKPVGRTRFHTCPGPHIQSLAHSGASHTNPCTLGASAHILSHSGDLSDTGSPPALGAQDWGTEQVSEVAQCDPQGVELGVVRGQ